MANENKKTVTTEELKEELNNLLKTETYTINNIFFEGAITTTKGSVTFSFISLGNDITTVNFLTCKYDATGTYDDLTTGKTFMSQVMTPTKNYGPFDASIVQNSITYEVKSVWDGIGQKYRYTLIVTMGDEVTDIQDATFMQTNMLT